ncbi:MAG TPA: FlgO family outer membrane protein, partial [Elusimicrobiales bacterium]|nr:FlgO family outer membrane protein [Elusimicrobiales bacterium]
MKILLIALSFINLSIFSQTVDNMCDNLFSSLDKTKENKIAIIEFSSINSKNEDAKIIRERITTKFAGYPKITLVERSLLDKVLSEIKLQTTGIINEKDMTKIGEMTGADYVITGTVNNLKNNKLEINSRIIEIKTGKIISAAKSSIDKDW